MAEHLADCDNPRCSPCNERFRKWATARIAELEDQRDAIGRELTRRRGMHRALCPDKCGRAIWHMPEKGSAR